MNNVVCQDARGIVLRTLKKYNILLWLVAIEILRLVLTTIFNKRFFDVTKEFLENIGDYLGSFIKVIGAEKATMEFYQYYSQTSLVIYIFQIFLLLITCLTILFLIFNIYKNIHTSVSKSVKITAIILISIKVIEIVLTILNIILLYLFSKNVNSQISVNATDQIINLLGLVIFIILYFNLLLIYKKDKILYKNYLMFIFVFIIIVTLNVIEYFSTIINYFFQKLYYNNFKNSSIYIEALKEFNQGTILAFIGLIAVSIFCFIIYIFLKEIIKSTNIDNAEKDELKY